MLEQIKVAGTASYPGSGETMDLLKTINFIFGTNGAGKTTISRIIADPASYPSCALTWTGARQLARYVYNADFVRLNYAAQMPGIFTLGEGAADILVQIDEAKKKVTEFQSDIGRMTVMLGPSDASSGKLAEQKKFRTAFEAACWKIKGKHDLYFKDAFAGARNSQTRFCDKILEEVKNNGADLIALDDLKKRAETLFSNNLQTHTSFPNIVLTDLLEVEAAPVLAKKVIGKEDVDVAALIRRLGNSDWVRQGLPYLEQGAQCPFCQQAVEADLTSRLNAYFDETYLREVAAIAAALRTYEIFSQKIVDLLDAIDALQSPFLDNDALRIERERLLGRLIVNKNLLEDKKREPSLPVTLQPLMEVAGPVIAILSAANTAIVDHNALVDNASSERGKLVGQIWKCILAENSQLIADYQKVKGPIDKAINGLVDGIASKNTNLTQAKRDLSILERRITSVQPTVDAINGILASFGFSGFRLETAGEQQHLYRIIRDDGGEAASTLSEGEKSFLSFLYFYHLLRGSLTESDITSERIVVFDDPVSSLDSDVLFIVSSLIKKVLREATERRGQIKQVFLLTHNIYFHKEVSFDRDRGATCRSHETFWVVRKVDGISKITGYSHNPIKTSYELLWAEVRTSQPSNMTIQNTLRRIIENYFKILGNVDTDNIIAKFSGRDQQLCASLFSWLNDGSHSVHDDLFVSAEDGLVVRYLEVFKEIFARTNHYGHYQMMMRLGDTADLAPGVSTQSA